jgi:hypothetical protein
MTRIKQSKGKGRSATLAILIPAEAAVGDRLGCQILQAAQKGVVLQNLKLVVEKDNSH